MNESFYAEVCCLVRLRRQAQSSFQEMRGSRIRRTCVQDREHHKAQANDSFEPEEAHRPDESRSLAARANSTEEPTSV